MSEDNRDKRDRDRFSAIVEEMIDGVAPQVKRRSDYPVVQFAVPRLFEHVIKVVDGLPSPCPECSLQAFTKVGDNLWCRAACEPKSAVPYAYETVGITRINLQKYKCGRCGRQDMVTMMLDQVNLQCWTCNQLTLHERVVEAQRIKGSTATINFKIDGADAYVKITPASSAPFRAAERFCSSTCYRNRQLDLQLASEGERV